MPEETGQTAAPEAPSMDFLSDDSLGSIYDKAGAEPEPTVTEPAAPEPETVKPEVAETVVETVEPASEPTTEPAEPPAEAVKPPASWTQDAKDLFLKSDPVIQQEVLKREGDFNKKMESSAERVKFAEQFDSVVAPYRAAIASQGAEPLGVFQSLLNTAYTLKQGSQQQKQAIIKEMIQVYGIDVAQVSPDSDEFVDPQILALQAELLELKNKFTGQEAATKQATQQGALKTIDTFRDDKDEKGVLKHPHFEAVKQEMSQMLNAGMATDIQSAYDKAIYSNPTIRSLILDAESKAAEAKRGEEIKKKSTEAKRIAGTNISSKGSTGGAASKGEFLSADSLGDQFDKIQSRA